METLKEDPGIFATHKVKSTGRLVRVVPETKVFWWQTGQARCMIQDVSCPNNGCVWAYEFELEAV